MGEPVAVIHTHVDYPDTWVAVVTGDSYSPRLLDGWRLFCSPKARWRESDMVVLRSKEGSLAAGTIHEHKQSYTLGALKPGAAPAHFEKAEVDFVQRVVAIELPPPDEDTADGTATEGDV